jgi:hypothetical protein
MLASGGSSLTAANVGDVVTALGGLLAGLAAVWGLLVAGPRYRLLYGPMKRHPIQEQSDGVEVVHWRVDVYLSGRGRRDITRQAFDSNEPVTLDIGVPIRSPIRLMWRHKVQRAVPYRVEGTRLLVGPGLIGRDQDLRFSFRTDSRPKRLICQASLVDVRVRRQFTTPTLRSVGLSLLASITFTVALFLGAALLAVFLGIAENPWISYPVPIIITVAFFGVPALLIWRYFASWSETPQRSDAETDRPHTQPTRAAADTRLTGSPAPGSAPPGALGRAPAPRPQAGSRRASRPQ